MIHIQDVPLQNVPSLIFPSHNVPSQNIPITKRPSVLLLILFVPVCCYTLSVRPSVLLLSVCVPVYCCSYCSSQCVAAHIFRPSVLLYSQCACPGVSEAVFKVPPSKREDGAGPGEAASPSSLYIYTASSQGPRRSFSAPPPSPPLSRWQAAD